MFGSVLLLGIGLSTGSFAIGIGPVALGGLLLSLVLMVVRAWLIPAKLSLAVAVTFAGLAGIAAVAAIAAAATLAPPAAEQPAATDQTMVQEAQADPDASELEEAQIVDAAADELQTEVDDLESDLADIESKVDDLGERAEKARAKSQKDAQAIASAKDRLNSLG
jgi:hypothetical protein